MGHRIKAIPEQVAQGRVVQGKVGKRRESTGEVEGPMARGQRCRGDER